MSKEHNGHPSYEHWNVCLWINNDEYLYSLARNCKRRYLNSHVSAALHLLHRLQDEGMVQTPDGVAYTRDLLDYVLRDLDIDLDFDL